MDNAIECDQQMNLNEFPWSLPRNHFTTILARHVFEHLDNIKRALLECEKLLVDGGELKLILPVGINAQADGDHAWGENGRPWTWQRPEFVCGKRHWDTDVGLTVKTKTVSLHSHYRSYALKWLQRAKWWLEKRNGGHGEWCFGQPASSGEFTVVFER